MEFPKSKFMYSLAWSSSPPSSPAYGPARFCRAALTRRYFRKSRRLPIRDRSFDVSGLSSGVGAVFFFFRELFIAAYE